VTSNCFQKDPPWLHDRDCELNAHRNGPPSRRQVARLHARDWLAFPANEMCRRVSNWTLIRRRPPQKNSVCSRLFTRPCKMETKTSDFVRTSLCMMREDADNPSSGQHNTLPLATDARHRIFRKFFTVAFSAPDRQHRSFKRSHSIFGSATLDPSTFRRQGRNELSERSVKEHAVENPFRVTLVFRQAARRCLGLRPLFEIIFAKIPCNAKAHRSKSSLDFDTIFLQVRFAAIR
jgi:hypothetical protein